MRLNDRETIVAPLVNAPVEFEFEPPGRLEFIRASEIQLEDGEFAIVSTPAHDPIFWAKLSPSERRIAALILEGRGDRDIARVRDCSPQTVTKQIDDLFDRLGVRTRAQLAQRLIPLFPER